MSEAARIKVLEKGLLLFQMYFHFLMQIFVSLVREIAALYVSKEVMWYVKHIVIDISDT